MSSSGMSQNSGSAIETPSAGATAQSPATGASPNGSQQAGNGSDSPLVARARRQAAAMHNSLALTQIIGVLLRSQHYRQYRLADLEWLVIPPVLAGQYRIGETKTKEGATMPIAVVLWAKVSPEVDARLAQSDDVMNRLKPDEWTSGDIVWLVHAAGQPRFVRHLLKQLSETAFKGVEVKVRGRGEDGKPTVQRLPAQAA
jgi:hemolysin-activating ACP:hemolysin acyltransferase